MKTPPQITFHHLPPTPALEAHVRDRLDDLESLFDGIVSCRVSIEAPPRHHHRGGLYRVHVEIGVPGDHIVAGRTPDERATHADPYVAVRDTFRAARRQLEDYVRRLHGNVKPHSSLPHE